MKTITATVLVGVIQIVVCRPVFFAYWGHKAMDLLTPWMDK